MVFTEEHNIFLLEAYFRTGTNNGIEWKYSLQKCREKFLQNFDGFEDIDYDVFTRHIRRVVARFRNTGSICKGKSTGRNTVLTKEVLDDVQDRLVTSPNKSLRSLAKQTSMSYGTCQRAIRKLHMQPYKLKSATENTQPSSSTCSALPSKIQGRRIIDLQYFFEKLQEIGSHKTTPGCSIASLSILKEISIGLNSDLLIRCNSCSTNFTCPLSDPVLTDLAEVTRSAIAGSVAAGIDYKGLTLLFDNIGIPTMTEEKFTELLTDDCKTEVEEWNSGDETNMPVEVFIKQECDTNTDYCDIDIKEEFE